MNLSKDRQGHLDDFNEMTLSELKDLLDKQEKILSKRKFLASLPDKGEKSRTFAKKLKRLIAERSSKEKNITCFNPRVQMSKGGKNESSLNSSVSQVLGENDMEDRTEETIKSLLSRNEESVTYHSSESNELITEIDSADSDDLAKQMQDLSVGDGGVVHNEIQNVHANSYERVIKRAEAHPSPAHSKFFPHKTKKISVLQAPSSQNKSPYSDKEESAVYPPPYSHESAKLISIDESIKLLQDQKIRAEQHAAERAAQKLTEHFAPKMETYQPSGIDMSYRQNDEQDSDDYASGDDDGDGT